MWNLIFKAAIGYLEAHPEKVQELIGEGIIAAVNAIKEHNKKQA